MELASHSSAPRSRLVVLSARVHIFPAGRVPCVVALLYSLWLHEKYAWALSLGKAGAAPFVRDGTDGEVWYCTREGRPNRPSVWSTEFVTLSF